MKKELEKKEDVDESTEYGGFRKVPLTITKKYGDLYIYEMTPIDFFSGVQTVDACIKNLVKEIEDLAAEKDFPIDITKIKYKVDEIQEINQLLKKGEKGVKEMTGWAGDHAQGPYIFFIPEDGNSSLHKGIIIRQMHAGDTYVVSEIELPWCE